MSRHPPDSSQRPASGLRQPHTGGWPSRSSQRALLPCDHHFNLAAMVRLRHTAHVQGHVSRSRHAAWLGCEPNQATQCGLTPGKDRPWGTHATPTQAPPPAPSIPRPPPPPTPCPPTAASQGPHPQVSSLLTSVTMSRLRHSRLMCGTSVQTTWRL